MHQGEVREVQEWVQRESAVIETLLTEIRKVIVGQDYLLDRMMIGVLADGHLLLEGVPGLAKTLAVSSLASAVHAKFQRVQFTPDLLPADLTGTLIYNQKSGEFEPRKGPLFANFVLADEINRAPAKVQSALLEAMQERQVTIGDTTYPLPRPFLVLATQNPIEQEGTYPLPEAQVDRFMLKLKLDYPKPEEERQILDRMGGARQPEATPVLELEALLKAREAMHAIYVDDRIKDYAVRLVHATRAPKEHALDLEGLLQFGASPRATLALVAAARAHAFLRGRGFVTPEDVKAIGPDVLRHRLILSFEAEAESVTADEVVQRVFDAVEVP
ncbi:MAG: AAA domain-containing protein [Acidobacteria bacterium]|nr:AAA domain-containing protein [Acidobacteriota bacterium]NIM60631.1 AAA domain-containing protein [Acidobacteriota bacterium]NIO57918.1 AAA domain-containing protein [Acidobacteriota bacterium]NIQ28921.1 AAA domain-containing protein [Acidobacteriota bacterium]NIQ83395.1 AAA domain-containing protein [Acidobacteriota bacterium]